jgi:acyl-CoA reductase-like NAD-dependent aldehyde dehydrogenase
VTLQDSEEIIERISAVHRRTQSWAKATDNPERKHALEKFACNLEKAFYGFEVDFFQQNLSRIVDDVVGDIRGAMELWPTLVEICYFRKQSRELPQTRVPNQKKK